MAMWEGIDEALDVDCEVLEPFSANLYKENTVKRLNAYSATPVGANTMFL